MQELGNAINDSLSESDRIAEAIGEIKKAGYDVFLVLEATIGFNRREEGSENEEEDVEVTEEPKRNFEAAGKIKFTSRITASCALSKSRWMTRIAERRRRVQLNNSR